MSDIILNSDGTASFSINLTGNINKQTYLGNFKVKCVLSPLEFIKADRLYRELLGHNQEFAHPKARNSAFAYSQLQYRIVESPPFWKNEELGGSHIEDENVISEVLEKAIQSEEEYRKNKEKEVKELQKKVTEKIKKGKISKKDESEE